MMDFEFSQITSYLSDIQMYLEKNTPVSLQKDVRDLSYKIIKLEREIINKDKVIYDLELKVAQQGVRIGQLL